jgi:hypothetical protein
MKSLDELPIKIDRAKNYGRFQIDSHAPFQTIS